MTFLGEEFSHAFNLKDHDDPLKKRKKYRKWHDFQHPHHMFALRVNFTITPS